MKGGAKTEFLGTVASDMSIIPLPDDEYYNIEIWSIDGIMVGKEN
jgi:hypothetical protein